MKHLQSYIQALFFAALFLLFISGTIGWAMIYLILGVGIFSVVTYLISRKHFTVQLECVSGLTERGERAELLLTLTKTGFCFLPNLDITLCPAEGETISVHTALTFGKTATVVIPVKTRYSGLNRCEVAEIVMQDFWNMLGNIRKPEGVFADYCVLPSYAYYNGPAVQPKLLPSEEETEEGKTVNSGGMPGFEHREYAAGDSLRRINYKLSAKRGKLMVRLDETSGTAPILIALSDKNFAEAGEMLMALSRMLVMQGISVTVTQSGESFSANSPQTLSRLREWIASRPLVFSPKTANSVIPPEADVIFDETGVRVSGVQASFQH